MKSNENLTAEQVIINIENSNKEFEAMTNVQKRVQIAKDCIARIKCGQLQPSTGRLYDFEDNDKDSYSNNIKDFINTKETICQTCAKGGLFMSYIGRVNSLDFSDISRDHKLNGTEMQKLQEIFTARQLDLIELVFEGVDNGWSGYLTPRITPTKDFSESIMTKVGDLYNKYPVHEDRVLYVLNNIIDNGGLFKFN